MSWEWDQSTQSFVQDGVSRSYSEVLEVLNQSLAEEVYQELSTRIENYIEGNPDTRKSDVKYIVLTGSERDWWKRYRKLGTGNDDQD